MQPMSNKKISEMAIAQQLISEFCGQQVMFTLHAMQKPKKTVSLIVNGGNDYMIGLKENQPTLYC
jgi:hypothetical protein